MFTIISTWTTGNFSKTYLIEVLKHEVKNKTETLTTTLYQDSEGLTSITGLTRQVICILLKRNWFTFVIILNLTIEREYLVIFRTKFIKNREP